MPPSLPADMAADSTATLQALCLAQAQELTYAKAAADGKSAPLLARCSGPARSSPPPLACGNARAAQSATLQAHGRF